MKNYTAAEVLKIAKRHNNAKRAYLLVNPLQGKHIPVSPNSALEMMKTLGDKVAAKYPAAKLVIGFAETATAIGAMVANSLAEDCIYIQTTRENFSGNFIEFLEEHSHAPQQKLYAENLRAWIDASDTIIFVDDEFSTGKTLRNMIRQLKTFYPNLNGKKLVAASIINRLTAENENLLEADGIFCEYLVKLHEENFDVSQFETVAPKILNPCDVSEKISFYKINFPQNPRVGVNIHEYIKNLNQRGEEILKLIQPAEKILVMGTEECMLPAIIFGKILEDGGAKVFTHSTTRSPIGVSSQQNYPINEGYQLKSFYDAARTTFIYNLKHYDLIFVVSDVENWQVDAVKSLIAALNVHGGAKIIFIGGNNVWHV